MKRRAFEWGYLTQTERIIKKFGSIQILHRALNDAGFKKDLATVYRWTYSKERGGTGGVIPKESLHDVVKAARTEGLYLSPEDLDPRPKKIRIYSPVEKLRDDQ
jgi:hypothetical protein